jgi:hypothetical protein
MSMRMLTTWPYTLRRGHTPNPADGACAMDAINWLVHGRHGDTPQCVSPVLVGYVTEGNDGMPDDVRQRLLPYLHRIAGSRSEEHESKRNRILQLAALRIFAPLALETIESYYYASLLRSLPDDVSVAAAGYAVVKAEQEASAIAARAAAHATTAAWRNGAQSSVALALLQRYKRAGVAALAMQEMLLVTTTVGCWLSVNAARVACLTEAWDDYFVVLDRVLNAGPQGEPWSADVVNLGTTLFQRAGGKQKETT